MNDKQINDGTVYRLSIKRNANRVSWLRKSGAGLSILWTPESYGVDSYLLNKSRSSTFSASYCTIYGNHFDGINAGNHCSIARHVFAVQYLSIASVYISLVTNVMSAIPSPRKHRLPPSWASILLIHNHNIDKRLGCPVLI